jgi:thioredoxin-like negative regulator of GroEL
MERLPPSSENQVPTRLVNEGVPVTPTPKPLLLFFTSSTSGPCRRLEGILSLVLQKRQNHDTFDLRFIDWRAWPELARRFGIEGVPTIVVLERNEIRARADQVRASADIRSVLAPWLR